MSSLMGSPAAHARHVVEAKSAANRVTRCVWEAGTAVAMVPDGEMLAGMEESQARDTLAAEPQAAAAYDRIPLGSGSCVFTMDTSTDILLLHSMQVG